MNTGPLDWESSALTTRPLLHITDQFEIYYCRIDIFKNSFFPYAIIEWSKLNPDVCKSKSSATFWNTLLKLGRPNQHAIYSINNPVGLQLLNHPGFGLSHFNTHRFNHNSQNCINSLCSCSLEIESTSPFFTALPALYKHPGLFRRGMLLHAHAPTHAQKHLKIYKSHTQIRFLITICYYIIVCVWLRYVPILMILSNRLSFIIKLKFHS